MQIEGMVDRICGLFPTTQIGRNTVKNAWVADDFLLDADVDEARKVTDWIKVNSDKFPASLKELHNIFRKVRGFGVKNQPIQMKCDICNGMLWDDGIRYSNAGVRLSEQYEVEEYGHTYKVVRPCPNCRGSDWQLPE
jgi:Zn finger protein HypA/HybF involved in hydrogenase expression